MKITVISDTHKKHKLLDLPEADMIIHCGDFSHSEMQALEFVEWFSTLDYEYKILVAGNHDKYVENIGYDKFYSWCINRDVIYLQDTSVNIEDINIYGSPWSNNFNEWAFMTEEPELQKIWDKIPDNTDILITHGPAYSIGDLVDQDIIEPNVGSITLLDRIKNLKRLKYHFFGHIHEAYGEYAQNTYIAHNAAMFNYYKTNLNTPHVYEIKSKYD